MTKTAIIPLLLMTVFLTSCRQKQPETSINEPLIVKLSEVKSSPLQEKIRAAGILSSKTQSNLSFLTGGMIRKINIMAGSHVRNGQVLAELDLTEIDSRVKQARLARDKAKRDLERVIALHADSVATLENLQNAQTAFDLASADLNIAEFNLEYSKITAPGNGRILKKLKEVNEITAAGHPVFVFASTEADWVLKISLADRDIVKVNLNDSALIRFDAYPGKEFTAIVSEISGAANLLSGTYDLELKLIDLPERLVTGLIGSATLFTGEKFFPLIPFVSLAEASELNAFIYVVQNDTAIRRKIRVHAITDKGVYVESGLTAGELIVTEGASYLKDNMPVKNAIAFSLQHP